MENSSRIEEESQAQTSEENDHNEEAVLAKAQGLIDKIISSYQDPNPDYLHALASILEAQESRYLEETGHSSSDSVRFSHTIGRLGTLIRDNDEFFELISSEIISDISYRASVQAASTRLLVSCSSTWMYPHVFDDATLDHLKSWAMGNFSSTVCEAELPMEFEMLRTYSTGLLAVALIGASQLVEDVLTSGLSVELMHYLRIRVFGETSSSHKDNKNLSENKNTSCITCTKVREDSRGRSRQLVETAHSGDPLPVDGNSGIERDHNIGNQSHEKGEASWTDGAHDDVNEGIDFCEVDAAEGDGLLSEDLLTGRMRVVEFDRNGADDTGRNRVNRVWGKSKGKGRNNEGSLDTEQPFASPKSRSRLGQARNSEDRSSLRNLETKVLGDVNKSSCRLHTDGYVVERDDNDDCFRECKLGSKDISDIVKKAVKAAEAEAQAVNAPAEAVRAAGDAAAESVKSAAVEEFKRTNNEEAAVVAASKYATMVAEAANAIQVLKTSRTASGDALNIDSSTIDAVAVNTDILEVVEPDIKQEVEEFFIPDDDSLAKLREKYSIQCLGVLGEYIEVLRPVLHEKGVDVCIALLVRSSKLKDPSKIAMLVPDVLKLISALAAHRKFAAMFVDRSGVQKLLAIPRVHQTFFGLSSCLFTIGSVQGIMERVCGLPADVVYEIVKLALELLECPQDPARKNAALFFSAAFVFRAILDCFDALDGQEKLLRLLNDAVCVRLGITSGAIGLSSLGSSQNDRSPSEVLTSSEKQITFHACVALRQYFRAHLLLLVDSIRPTKNNRSASRTIPCLRAAYKPLDLSNEAMDAVILQLQKDRKLGPLFVRAFWPAVVKFLTCKGHIILLELCQAPPDERYLHELLQYALGVLHIVTLVPGSRKQIVNAPLSNDRVGVAVILDAANANASGVNSLETEVVQPALNVLVNLVCPSPSISNKSSPVAEGQHASVQNLSCPVSNSGERIIDNVSEQSVSTQTEGRERNSESKHGDRGTPQIPVPSGLVGERRISLGVGSGCAGLAAQLEQGYSQARDAVRSNNGIKVLLHVLQARVAVPPAALDCIHALACRVLLGLARDDVIAHILTKLQIGKKLSELIRDTSVQTPGTEQARWQAELAQVAIELIGIVTNSGRASTLAATDAATPTLRRIERAAIAAATPITYHSRELLLLIHEHLQASGFANTAATLLNEAHLSPLLSLATPFSLSDQSSREEIPSVQLQWPAGRTLCGFLLDKWKCTAWDEQNSTLSSSKKKPLAFSSSLSFRSRNELQAHDPNLPSTTKVTSSKQLPPVVNMPESSSVARSTANHPTECPYKTPIVLPMKRRLTDAKDGGSVPSQKRLNIGDHGLRSPIAPIVGFSKHARASQSYAGQITPSQLVVPNSTHSANTERLTLDSLVIHHLKNQHRQCPAPITTLPPLSLLHPHVCPEPKHSLDEPLNITARLSARSFRSRCGGVHRNRRDRQFIYSRFRPWRPCRDDGGVLMTCLSFLGDSSHIAVGTHNGELKIFDSTNNNLLESSASDPSFPLTRLQSHSSTERQLLLSSSSHVVRLWDASAVSGGPLQSFEGCKAARFSNSGNVFAALSLEASRREILLYDIQSSLLELKLSDTSVVSSAKVSGYCPIHFSPCDSLLLWNGVLWDRRASDPIHRFDQFTDYGGGGFHPAGNEVIINSEVWDLRKFRLLRSVPSLDQTVITFNGRGDVIYAILRRSEDITLAVNQRRSKHPLFSAFRTVDAVNYSEIATTPVDRCVLDFATEPKDYLVGLLTMDDPEDMSTSARIYEVGRRRPTDDDSDPDEAESDEEDEDGDEDAELLGDESGSDSEGEDDMGDEDEDSLVDVEDDDGDGNLMMDDVEFDVGHGVLEVLAEGNEDDSDEEDSEVEFGSDEDSDAQ